MSTSELRVGVWRPLCGRTALNRIAVCSAYTMWEGHCRFAARNDEARVRTAREPAADHGGDRDARHQGALQVHAGRPLLCRTCSRYGIVLFDREKSGVRACC